MPDEAAAVSLRMRSRLRHGLRQPANWLQLVRFAAVGASGYAVNLATFALLVHAVGIDYRVGAVAAFLVAVLNNFWWNRRWTFEARTGHAGFQAARFFVVSIVAFGVNYVILVALVSGTGLVEVVAQAIAIVASTPVSFIGNKLWSFAG